MVLTLTWIIGLLFKLCRVELNSSSPTGGHGCFTHSLQVGAFLELAFASSVVYFSSLQLSLREIALCIVGMASLFWGRDLGVKSQRTLSLRIRPNVNFTISLFLFCCAWDPLWLAGGSSSVPANQRPPFHVVIAVTAVQYINSNCGGKSPALSKWAFWSFF